MVCAGNHRAPNVRPLVHMIHCVFQIRHRNPTQPPHTLKFNSHAPSPDVAGLQQADGSFVGDEWGEVDTRFSYAALLTCSIMGRTEAVNLGNAVDFVLACKNFDGGFGCTPGERQGRANATMWVRVLCCPDAAEQQTRTHFAAAAANGHAPALMFGTSSVNPLKLSSSSYQATSPTPARSSPASAPSPWPAPSTAATPTS
jgi:hypothetical protein